MTNSQSLRIAKLKKELNKELTTLTSILRQRPPQELPDQITYFAKANKTIKRQQELEETFQLFENSYFANEEFEELFKNISFELHFHSLNISILKSSDTAGRELDEIIDKARAAANDNV